MDPSEPQSSPSAKFSTLNLNSTPTKRALDFTLDASSSASVLGDAGSNRSYSPAESPSPPASPSPPKRRRTLTNPRLTGMAKSSPKATPPNTNNGDVDTTSVVKSRPPLPYEIWSMIFFMLVAVDRREEYSFTPAGIYEAPKTKQIFSTLRLVSREWNEIISPLMFSSLSAMVGRISHPLEALFKISGTRFACHVRDLRFGVVGAWHNEAGYERYITDLSTGALPVLLSRFPNLQTLRLQSPTVIASFSLHDQMSTELLAKLTSSLVHSLRYVAIPRLKCLYLSLPVTAEFARFFLADSYAIEFTTILSRIEEMHLVINDDSGRDGHRNMTRPRSRVKYRYPLQPFSGYLTTFVSYATKIRILSLESRSPLDLSDLEVQNLTKLACLSLVGVSIKWTVLRDIFTTACGTLRRLEIKNVKLLTGTWQDVFDMESDSLANLEFFVSFRCGYATTGASAQHIGLTRAFWSDSLLTSHGPDWASLAKLKRRVNQNRKEKGLSPSPHTIW